MPIRLPPLPPLQTKLRRMGYDTTGATGANPPQSYETPKRFTECVTSRKAPDAGYCITCKHLMAVTDELTAMDDRTLRFRLTKPFPHLLAALTVANGDGQVRRRPLRANIPSCKSKVWFASPPSGLETVQRSPATRKQR
jgi:hypothetical protein